jgi:hypothetical protein
MISPEIAARDQLGLGSSSWYCRKLQTTMNGVVSYQLGQYANMLLEESLDHWPPELHSLTKVTRVAF